MTDRAATACQPVGKLRHLALASQHQMLLLRMSLQRKLAHLSCCVQLPQIPEAGWLHDAVPQLIDQKHEVLPHTAQALVAPLREGSFGPQFSSKAW
jgi:hypothetical protein